MADLQLYAIAVFSVLGAATEFVIAVRYDPPEDEDANAYAEAAVRFLVFLALYAVGGLVLAFLEGIPIYGPFFLALVVAFGLFGLYRVRTGHGSMAGLDDTMRLMATVGSVVAILYPIVIFLV